MPEDRRFICTGFLPSVRRKLTRQIKELGGHIVSAKNLGQNEEFVLICAEPKWTEKLITACACGMWVLTPDFVEDSHKLGCWMKEKIYEWTYRKRGRVGDRADKNHLLNAPRSWRKQVASTGLRAFENWHVIFLIQNARSRAAYSRIVVYGGGTIRRRSEFRDDTAWKSLTHIFLDEEFCSRHESMVSDLRQKGVKCLHPSYIRDFIAQLGLRDAPEDDAPSPELFRTESFSLSWRPREQNLKEGDQFRKAQSHKKNLPKEAACVLRGHELKNKSEQNMRESSIRSSLSRSPQKSEALIVLERLEDVTEPKAILCPNFERIGDKLTRVLKKCCKEITLRGALPIETRSVILEDVGNKLSSNYSLKRSNVSDIGLECVPKKSIRALSAIAEDAKRSRAVPSLLGDPVIYDENSSDMVTATQKQTTYVSSRVSTSDRPLNFKRVVPKEMMMKLNLVTCRSQSLKDKTDREKQQKENCCVKLPSIPSLSDVSSEGVVVIKRLSEGFAEQNSQVKNIRKRFLSSNAISLSSGCHHLKEKRVLEKLNEQLCCAKKCIHNFKCSVSENTCDDDKKLTKGFDTLVGTKKVERSGVSLLKSANKNVSSRSEHVLEAVSVSDLGCVTLSHLKPVECERSIVQSVPTRSQPSQCKKATSKRTVAMDDVTDFPPIGTVSTLPARQETLTGKKIPTTLPKMHYFTNSAVSLIESCLDSEDYGGAMCSQFSTRMFADAVSSFLSPSCYPPLKVLSLVLRVFIKECRASGAHVDQLSLLLRRILFLPSYNVISSVCLQAVAEVSGQSANLELIEHLFKNVFECNERNVLPTADMLFLRFVVHFLEVDFQEAREKLLTSGSVRGRLVRRFILGQWLWTSEFSAVRSAQFCQLITILVTVIRPSGISTQIELVVLIQRLVAMAADAWSFSSEYSPRGSCVPRDLWMFAHLVAEKLGDATNDHLKLFLETCKTNWLALLVCKILLDRMTPKVTSSNEVITLRTTLAYFQLELFEEAGGRSAPMSPGILVSPGVKFDQTARVKPLIISLKPKPTRKLKQKLTGVNRQNAKGESSLHVACRKNNLKLVQELLKNPGVDVNLCDNAGWTPLHEACCFGNVDVVRELLLFTPKRTISSYFGSCKEPSDVILPRVNIKATSLEDGITALHDAVMSNNLAICRLLLEHGGTQLLAIEDKKGRRPLDYASTDEMRRLLSGSDVHQKPQGLLRSQAGCLTTSFPSEVSALGGRSVSPVPQSIRSRSISEENSQRFFLLASRIAVLYLDWKGQRLGSEDKEIAKEMPQFVDGFRERVLHLQNGNLRPSQMAVLLQLKTLATLLSSSVG